MNTEERIHLAALAGLDMMTTARMFALQRGRTAIDAFAVASGEAAPSGAIAALFERNPTLRTRWAASAASNRPDDVAQRCGDLDLRIVVPGDAAFPSQLEHDPRRPAVLFARGCLDALAMRRVGIVGTRNPTRRGTQTATRFGSELAAAGVAVVSGLALGVDGAAHRGALAVPGGVPVAVVANGHDDPYPRRHATLWQEVAERGVVISEWPPGTRPEPFRFPQRNRILAALSELLVVVESRERGGSLITAREAAERGIDVFAVPGPVDQRSSIGTNRLLEDGAAAASSIDPILASLGMDHRRAGRAFVETRRAPAPDEAVVLALVRHRSQSIESVARAAEQTLGGAARLLARLEHAGWVVEVGGWYEALDSGLK